MKLSTSTLLATLITTISAHGNITSPAARLPGPAMAKACGPAAVASVMADGTTPLEDVDISGASATCRLDLCRGATFEDNAANVQRYAPGQIVRMTAILPIPHEGPMNVSIVDIRANKVVGPPLIEFKSYADENLATLPANNTDFSVQMPANLPAGACAQAGQCTMQWFWFGTGAKQTYESCVDFVMMPAGAAAAPGAPPAVPGAPAPAPAPAPVQPAPVPAPAPAPIQAPPAFAPAPPIALSRMRVVKKDLRSL